jgi:hypothetical protein
LIKGTDTGGYVDNVLVVKPGKLGRYPRSSVVLSVDNTSENRVACANATRSAGEVDVMAAKLTCRVVTVVGGAAGVRGGVETILRCHKPMSGDWSPFKLRLLQCRTLTVVAEKIILQPASHNWLMDNNERVRKAGTMWTWRAEMGRIGKSSSAS